MRKRVLLLVNPVAGKTIGDGKLMTIIEILAKNNCEVTVYPILPGDNMGSEEIIAEVKGKFDVISCIGGDGTLNHMINAVIENDVHVPIGYFPSGSTNDFSRNMQGTTKPEELALSIASGREFKYDIGKLNDRYFNYVAGFGAFTEVSYSTDQHMKNIFGYGAYMMNMLSTLPKNISYRVHAVVSHDGIIDEDDYVFGGVMNSTSIAGVRSPLVEQAELDDGKFEVLLVKAPNNIVEISEIVNSLTTGNTDNAYVKLFPASHVRIHTERPVGWTMDGEDGGMISDAEITILHDAMTIMIPEKS